MTNERFRVILYNILRQCDRPSTPDTERVGNVRTIASNALEVLRQECDTALTVEKEIVIEENGDRIYA